MKIIAMRTGQPARIEELPDTLEAMQAFVGGYIEGHATDRPGLMLICHGDARLMSSPPPKNRVWTYDGRVVDTVVGDCFLTRINAAGDSTDVSAADLAYAVRCFPICSMDRNN